MKFDDSKTMIDDLADENEEPAAKEEFDFDLLDDGSKKDDEEDYSMDSMFGDVKDEDLPPPPQKKEGKISTGKLIIIVWALVIVAIGVMVYTFLIK